MEGPSLKVVAEELAFLSGEKINAAFGNAKIEKENLLGKEIKRVFTRGKNLLIQFPEYTVRVHFIMFGKYSVNKPREDLTPSLSLKTESSIVEFYRCSIRMLRNEEVNVLFDEEVDIMSDNWNFQKVLKLTLNQDDELICDVLLDQEIFAGVGNIIKNEALFLAGVHPVNKVGDIPIEKVKEILCHTRSFSKIFYDTRKNNQRLRPYFKIYQKSKCTNSEEKVIRTHTGKRNRLSFICPTVQLQYLPLTNKNDSN